MRRTLVRVWGIRSALAGIVLILAACSSPAEPETLEPLPSHSATRSPVGGTPQPTRETSSTTAPAHEGPGEAAIKALDAYFRAANRASRGRAIDELRSRFAESCALCATQYRNFSSAYSAGNSATGTLYEDWSISVVDETDRQVVLQSIVDTGAITLRDESDQVLDEFPAESDMATVWTLARDEAGAWLIIDARDLL